MNLLSNGLSGALAAQVALNATSQNIANVATAGYTRQGVTMRSVQSSGNSANPAGEGVRVPSLTRFSDNYKNLQLWQSASELSSHTVVQPYLTQLEQVMGDDGSSLSSGIDSFFGALNAASVEPTSSPLRQQVISSADALGQRFGSLQQVLSNQRAAIGQQRTTLVTQVNTLTSGIAELNKQIANAEALGNNASSLIDERDQQTDSLAGIVSLQVIDQGDGTRNISLKGGQPLVVGSSASAMRAVQLADGTQSLQLQFARETFGVTGDVGAQLGGLDKLQTQMLTPLMQSVSDMAGAIANQVNAKLQAGYALDGTGGKALFQFDASSIGALLGVAPDVGVQDLGFSSDPAQPGNSDNLLALIDLQQQPVVISSLGNVLLGDAYPQLVGKLGTVSQQNQTAATTARTVRDQADQSWKSTSGVNNDEEAVNLVQYQQMYQANMKVVAVANALFDSTLQMLN